MKRWAHFQYETSFSSSWQRIKNKRKVPKSLSELSSREYSNKICDIDFIYETKNLKMSFANINTQNTH
jgi:hypothetical protein